MFIHSSVYRLLDQSQNPALPNMLARSAYSLDKIKATLAEAEKVRAEYEALYNQAHEILEPIKWFERNDSEHALAELITDNAYIQCGARFDEMFPLTQWQKAISRQRTHNRKIEKALRVFENVKA